MYRLACKKDKWSIHQGCMWLCEWNAYRFTAEYMDGTVPSDPLKNNTFNTYHMLKAISSELDTPPRSPREWYLFGLEYLPLVGAKMPVAFSVAMAQNCDKVPNQHRELQAALKENDELKNILAGDDLDDETRIAEARSQTMFALSDMLSCNDEDKPGMIDQIPRSELPEKISHRLANLKMTHSIYKPREKRAIEKRLDEVSALYPLKKPAK